MQLLSNPVSKISTIFLGEKVARKKGIIPTAVSGTGAEIAMKSVDNIFGGVVQNLLSVNLPIVGTIGPIDILNFMIHGGIKSPKSGLTAVIGSKVLVGGLRSLGPISLPGIAQPTGAPISPTTSQGASF
jgi:hypothetical protein